jgi:hypothetical protein
MEFVMFYNDTAFKVVLERNIQLGSILENFANGAYFANLEEHVLVVDSHAANTPFYTGFNKVSIDKKSS